MRVFILTSRRELRYWNFFYDDAPWTSPPPPPPHRQTPSSPCAISTTRHKTPKPRERFLPTFFIKLFYRAEIFIFGRLDRPRNFPIQEERNLHAGETSRPFNEEKFSTVNSTDRVFTLFQINNFKDFI